jgi:hypothetical protein
MKSYCDYIAHLITKIADREDILADIGPVRLDLHPRDGYLMSTKKTVMITDRNGRRYRVSVEEIPQDQ